MTEINKKGLKCPLTDEVIRLSVAYKYYKPNKLFLNLKDKVKRLINYHTKIPSLYYNYKIDFASFFHDFYGGKDSVNDCLNSNYGNKYKSGNFTQITEILQDTIANEFNQEKIISIKENKENLLISEVEKIWQQIEQFDNWELLNRKVKKLRNLGKLLNSQKLVNF